MKERTEMNDDGPRVSKQKNDYHVNPCEYIFLFTLFDSTETVMFIFFYLFLDNFT